MALLTPNNAIKNIVIQVAGLPVVYYSHFEPASTAGMRSGLEDESITTYALKSLVGLSSIEWEAPDVGGYVKYRPIEVTLATDGPNSADEWDPARVFGRYDGGGWTARLTETLAADNVTSLTVDTELTGTLPQVIYGAQEAIVVDGITDNLDGTWTLDIAARGAGDTPPQTHEVRTGSAPAYFTTHPTFWAQRSVSIWHGYVDPAGNLIGSYEERWVGEIDGQMEVAPSAVRMTLKPLTGVVARAPALKEPEVFELATGVHRFIRGRRSKLQIAHETYTAANSPAWVQRIATGEIHEAADADEITIGWPGAALRRLNSTLESSRGAADPDSEADGGHVKVTIKVEEVIFNMEDDTVSDQAKVSVASSPEIFTRNDLILSAPNAGDDLISPIEQISWGVDVNPISNLRTPDNPDGEWDYVTNRWFSGRADDRKYVTRPWPKVAYAHPDEGGILLKSAPSSIPADGLELLILYVDENGEEREAPLLATAVDDLGDGTYWLTVSSAREWPAFGQYTEDDPPKIVPAVYARNLPFWRFILETMASGTGLEALGAYDVHINGSGVLGFRINVESFKAIRLPAAFADVSGAALRDPTKIVRSILKMALTCIGMDTGPDGRARLTAFRREAARPDLARTTLTVSDLPMTSGDAALPTLRLPQGANTISIKVADENGEPRPVEIRNPHGVNGANRQVFHLGAVQPDGETLDLDLSAVNVGISAGDATAALLPAAQRIFTLTTEGRRRFTVGVDGDRINVGNIRPYDVMLLTTPLVQLSNGKWGITERPVRVVAAAEPQLDDAAAVLVLEDASVTGVGRNACGLITARTATTITISETEYVDPYSIVDGTAQKGIDQFQVGDNVNVAAWGDWSNAVSTSITDITGNVMTLADAPPAMAAPDYGIVWPADYADMSAAHRQLLVMGDADGVVATGVDAGVIT